jgi:hypothetical protein
MNICYIQLSILLKYIFIHRKIKSAHLINFQVKYKLFKMYIFYNTMDMLILSFHHLYRIFKKLLYIKLRKCIPYIQFNKVYMSELSNLSNIRENIFYKLFLRTKHMDINMFSCINLMFSSMYNNFSISCIYCY